jgi:hypothetical protein
MKSILIVAPHNLDAVKLYFPDLNLKFAQEVATLEASLAVRLKETSGSTARYDCGWME